MLLAAIPNHHPIPAQEEVSVVGGSIVGLVDCWLLLLPWFVRFVGRNAWMLSEADEEDEEDEKVENDDEEEEVDDEEGMVRCIYRREVSFLT